MSDSNNPEKMDEFFDKRAVNYEHHMATSVISFSKFYQAVSSPIVKINKRIEILDLGCGTGLEIEGFLLKAPNAFITCIDLSERMLELLKEKYSEHLGQLRLVKGSFVETPLAIEKYDYVVSVMSLHHYTRDTKRKIYRKIVKSLKRKGRYIEGDWTVPQEEEYRYLRGYQIKMQKLKEAGESIYHIDIPFSMESQRRLMLEAGFDKIEIIFQTEKSAVFVAHAN